MRRYRNVFEAMQARATKRVSYPSKLHRGKPRRPLKEVTMPTGKVKKVVWLSQQSSRAVQNPSRNEVGYGYIDGDEEDQDIYFDYKAVKDHPFEDVQVGQPVEYVRDKSYPIASSVMLVGALLPRRS